MSDSSIAVAGQAVQVVLPGDTAYAKEQATLALAARQLAEQAAGIATAVAQGRYYASYAAGNAATTAGQYFAVFTGGNYNFHVNGNATPVFVMPKIDAAGNLTITGTGNQIFNMTGPKADFGISVDGTNNAGGITISYSWAAGGQGPLKFANSSGEVARFDAGGNFGLGVSPAARFHVKSAGGFARMETTAARGSGLCFMDFFDPTGQKSYFAYAGLDDTFYQMNRMNAGIIFGTNDINRWLIAANGHFYPQTDNAYNVGAAATGRVKDTYQVNSATVTSDAREKTWRGGPSEKEVAAAKRIIGELGFYQWNDAVMENGPSGARFHFGARAQAVWGIMADEGLIDPITEGVTPSSSYAFLCYDEWDAIDAVDAVEEVRDEEGAIIVQAQLAQPGRDAGNRFGIRPDQLALFLIAAQEARLSALEAAL